MIILFPVRGGEFIAYLKGFVFRRIIRLRSLVGKGPTGRRYVSLGQRPRNLIPIEESPNGAALIVEPAFLEPPRWG